MRRGAQAFRDSPDRASAWPLALGLFTLALAGCGAGRSVVQQAEIDRTVYTSATDAQGATDQTAISDAVTIRNAVSSADLDGIGGGGLGWENADTGSEGTITAIRETRDAGMACRSFTASKQAFDGIAMFAGETCLGQGGEWMMKAFRKL